jgi:hypothetical protein
LFHLYLRGGIPPSFETGETYSLLILTEPAPREYKGRVEEENTERVFLLYRGKEKENRNASRYRVNFSAQLVSLIRQNEAYELHTPIDVCVVNISKTGIRLSAPANALRKGDKVKLQVNLDSTVKHMTAIVTNYLDTSEYMSEYGCRLVADKK